MVLEEHLVCDLRMNEGSGTVTRDRSGNDAKGTFGAGGEAPSWADGKWGIGKALSFDGGDILTVNDLITLLAAVESGAIEAWAKIDTDAGANETIFSVSRNVNATLTELLVLYNTGGATDNFIIVLRVDGTTQWSAASAVGTVDPYIGEYVHLVLTQDGIEPTLSINGNLSPLIFSDETDKTAWFKALITDAASPSDVATVGAVIRNGAKSIHLTGDVQVLRVYDAVPSPQQVRALYAEGLIKLRDGRVLDMPFNEGSGTVTRDRSPSDIQGVLTPGAGGWVEGRNGRQAIDFDGADTRVNCGNPSSVDNIFDGGGSLSVWINPDSDGEAGSGRIFDKRDPGWLCLVKSEAGGKVEVRLHQDFDITDGVWDTTFPIVVIGEDTHLVITYDSMDVGNDPIFYINGVSYTVDNGITETTTPEGSSADDSTKSLGLGGRTTGTNVFDGKIDSPLLYKRILSPREVRELYEATK